MEDLDVIRWLAETIRSKTLIVERLAPVCSIILPSVCSFVLIICACDHRSILGARKSI
jgi:cytochrome c oxidase subunit IV